MFMESRDADIDMLREKATTAFKDLSFQTTSSLKGLGTKATSLYDSVGENVGGFVKSGADDFTRMLGVDEIKQNAMAINKGANIKEEGMQLQFQEQEANIISDADAQMSELQAQHDRSQGWYPGKYIGKIFG